MWQKFKNLVGIKPQTIKKDSVQCGICISQFQKEKLINLCLCEHKFCKQCLKYHIDSKIKSYEIIDCPQEQCKAQINQLGGIYAEIPKEKLIIYEKIKRFHFVSKNPEFKLCPKEQCHGMVNIKVLGSSSCNVCEQKYCPKCLYKQHRGKCEKQSILHLQNDLKFVQCMNCDFIIQKNQGCDHIRCRCGHQLCYKCGGLWKGAGHICIRSKSFQRVRSACLFVQDKIKSSYRFSFLYGAMTKLSKHLANIFFVNLVLALVATCTQLFVNVFLFFVSIFYTGNEADQQSVLSFQYLWPYIYFAISFSVSYVAFLLDKKVIRSPGKLKYGQIIFLTLIIYFYLPNLLYVYYYEVLLLLSIWNNIFVIIVSLLSIYITIELTFWKFPNLRKTLTNLMKVKKLR